MFYPNAQSDNAGSPVDSRVVKTSAGRVFQVTLTNTNGGTRYLQLFDRATALTGGEVPLVSIPIPAGQVGWVSFDVWGRPFSNGLVVANSQTQATYTAGSADSLIDTVYS